MRKFRMGFTHMGQYAQDYRSLFSESPTMTLRRAQSRDAQRDENTAPPPHRDVRTRAT